MNKSKTTLAEKPMAIVTVVPKVAARGATSLETGSPALNDGKGLPQWVLFFCYSFL
jgi:hypothetical protein